MTRPESGKSTRHGKPVARLPAAGPRAAFYEWLAGRRARPTGPPLTSVQLQGLIYDDPGA